MTAPDRAATLPCSHPWLAQCTNGVGETSLVCWTCGAKMPPDAPPPATADAVGVARRDVDDAVNSYATAVSLQVATSEERREINKALDALIAAAEARASKTRDAAIEKYAALVDKYAALGARYEAQAAQLAAARGVMVKVADWFDTWHMKPCLRGVCPVCDAVARLREAARP